MNIIQFQMDIAGAMSPVEAMQMLELERIADKPWHITSFI
jgi:hypothetical protein